MTAEAIAHAIVDATGIDFVAEKELAVSGGCINSACVLSDGDQQYFVKLNGSDQLDMFEAEADGLRELNASKGPRVPQPVCAGIAQGQAFLVMEYIEFGHAPSQGLRMFGQRLAAMHAQHHAEFGWYRDNTIGSTPQINTSSSDWPEFFIEHRLGYQYALAAKQGFGGELQTLGDKLLLSVADFFSDYQPWPALLHGDLWGGNHAFDESGEPVIFDPATYFGDREADIAMTELFGGLSHDFYAAYNDVLALDVGYAQRKTLYNLYHILNHLNLFGGGYSSQAIAMSRQLLALVR